MLTIQDFFKVGMKRFIPELLPSTNSDVHLELGPGNTPVEFENYYSLDYPEWNADKNDCKIPFGDEVFGIVHAYNFLEHINEPVKMLREIERVLRKGGHVNIVVPHSSASTAFEDLDHKSFFNEETWKTLLENPWYDKDKRGWNLKIHCNFILAIKARNLANFVQLVKI